MKQKIFTLIFIFIATVSLLVVSNAGQLAYSTFLGGQFEEKGYGITVDKNGNAYITGYTGTFTNFPTTPGAFDTTHNGNSDVFVSKLNSNGSALVYSTFLGGSNQDQGKSIAVDSIGNAYITGFTWSSTFPTTPGAFDTTYNNLPVGVDTFVSKLNIDGSALLYSTFLGGGGGDYGIGIALDIVGNAYIMGWTDSSNFPTTPGAFDTSWNGSDDVFVSKLNPNGTVLDYSTFLGGERLDYGTGIAVDSIGNAYITGYTNSTTFPTTPGSFDITYNGGSWDIFVSMLNNTGSSLVYSSYLGGTGDDYGRGIALDDFGDVYITGYTNSTTFPTTPGAFNTTFNGSSDNVFVSKLNSFGSVLLYSTSLGKGRGYSIALDNMGNAFVTGYAGADFPTTVWAFDTSFNGSIDAFISKLNTTGSALINSTFLGGENSDYGYSITVDNTGCAYITGETMSFGFPTTPGAFDTTYNVSGADVFISKLDMPVPVELSLFQALLTAEIPSPIWK